MEQTIIEAVLSHAMTILCAAAGGFAICVAYSFSVPARLRVSWLPLVIVLLAVTTALVISVIKGSIALSLGLIGALSIARFRTRIEDPRLLAIILVTIATGVGCGAGEFLLTGVGTAIAAGLIVVFYYPESSAVPAAPVPKVIAQLRMSDGNAVSVEAVSETLAGCHGRFSIRNMARNEGRMSLTIHLLDCHLAAADEVMRQLAEAFPAHQCEWELQFKTILNPSSTWETDSKKDNQSGVPDSGARMPVRNRQVQVES